MKVKLKKLIKLSKNKLIPLSFQIQIQKFQEIKILYNHQQIILFWKISVYKAVFLKELKDAVWMKKIIYKLIGIRKI